MLYTDTIFFFIVLQLLKYFKLAKNFFFEKRVLNQICGFLQHFLALFETFTTLQNDPCIKFDHLANFDLQKPFLKFFLFENVLKGPFQPLCTALLLDFDYQLPCTFERPAAIAAIAGDRQLAAPRGRAVGQSSSLQAAGGRFSSQASYGLAWLYKKVKFLLISL